MMTAENLRFVADALLALCENESSSPFYTDQELRLKSRREVGSEKPIEPMMRGEASDVLLDNEWEGVLSIANLTEKQNRVLHDRLKGHSFESIAQRLGNTKQATQKIFVAALKKITRARNVYVYTGLSDVYRIESHRGRHNSPRRRSLVQCTAGQRTESVRRIASTWSRVNSAAP